jgi:hypothetical protein
MCITALTNDNEYLLLLPSSIPYLNPPSFILISTPLSVQQGAGRGLGGARRELL